MYCVGILLSCLLLGEFPDEKSKAVLVGIESSRASIGSYRANFDVKAEVGQEKYVFSLLIEHSSEGQRYEAEKNFGVIIIRRGEKISLHGNANSSLSIYDSSENCGEIAFDARILGLTEWVEHTETVPVCLMLDQVDNQFTLETGVELNGLILDKAIVVTPKVGRKEFWVDRKDFRVYRVEQHFKKFVAITESSFLPSNHGPIPDHVKILRKEGDVVDWDMEFDKRSFEEVQISPDRFELTTMIIPPNTLAYDTRLKKYLGYWNGTDYFNSDPEYEVQEVISKKPNHFFYYYTAGGAVLLASLCWAVFRYSRKQ